MRSNILSSLLVAAAAAWLGAASVHSEPVAQIPVPATERMPALPSPLAVRNWNEVSRACYKEVFDPRKQGEGFPAVLVDGDGTFRMKSYLKHQPDTEGLSCLSSIVGAKFCGLDPRNLNDIDFLIRTKTWNDAEAGVIRLRSGEKGPNISADIYGYWPAIMGLEIASLYPEDPDLKHAAETTFQAFHQIANGLGAPAHPDFGGLGWNFRAQCPGGRDEPMNRLGNATSVAWVLMVGGANTGSRDMLECSRAAMEWHIEHPGRHEISHVMGPLIAARLNTMGVEKLDVLFWTKQQSIGQAPEQRSHNQFLTVVLQRPVTHERFIPFGSSDRRPLPCTLLGVVPALHSAVLG